MSMIEGRDKAFKEIANLLLKADSNRSKAGLGRASAHLCHDTILDGINTIII